LHLEVQHDSFVVLRPTCGKQVFFLLIDQGIDC